MGQITIVKYKGVKMRYSIIVVLIFYVFGNAYSQEIPIIPDGRYSDVNDLSIIFNDVSRRLAAGLPHGVTTKRGLTRIER